MSPDDLGIARALADFELTSQIPTIEISFEKTAVEAGDFEVAKKEFQGFEETWGKLEGEWY